MKVKKTDFPQLFSTSELAIVARLWYNTLHIVHAHVHVYARSCAYTNTFTCVYICTCMCMYMHMYKYVYVHVDTSTYMYVHIHACTIATVTHFFPVATVTQLFDGPYRNPMHCGGKI
jgi:hypothetical protein